MKKTQQHKKQSLTPVLQSHDFANIFPLLDDAALEMLANDIKQNGLRETVVTYEGKVLDGRNRSLACAKAGIVPRTKEFNGNRKDALDYVLSLNLHRRQMDESGRALAAARFLKHSGNRFSIPQARKLFNVSESSIGHATKVMNTGHHSLIKDVESGDMPVSLAKNIAGLDPREQDNLFQSTDIKDRIKVARSIPKSPRRRLDTQQNNTKDKEIFDGKVEVSFNEEQMKDIETAIYLTGETSLISFVQHSVIRQCNLIQRAYIVAQKSEALFDGSKTSPEQKRNAQKKFTEALYDNTEGVEKYFVLDNEQRAKSNEEKIAATAAYTFKKNERLRKEATEKESIARAIKERQEKEHQANQKYTDAQIEQHARGKIKWEKEQDAKRADAKRKGIKFIERYNQWSATKKEHDDWARENGMDELEKAVDERVKEIRLKSNKK